MIPFTSFRIWAEQMNKNKITNIKMKTAHNRFYFLVYFLFVLILFCFVCFLYSKWKTLRKRSHKKMHSIIFVGYTHIMFNNLNILSTFCITHIVLLLSLSLLLSYWIFFNSLNLLLFSFFIFVQIVFTFVFKFANIIPFSEAFNDSFGFRLIEFFETKIWLW